MNPITSSLYSLCKAYHELGYTTEIYQPRYIDTNAWVSRIKKDFSKKTEQEKQQTKEKFKIPQKKSAAQDDRTRFRNKLILLGLEEDLETVKSILKSMKPRIKKVTYRKIEKRINILEKKVERKFKGL